MRIFTPVITTKANAMKTVKDILSENRDSIISSIKYTFKVYDKEGVKNKMIEFFAWAQENESKILDSDNATNTKTRLKNQIVLMARKATKANNLRMYGTERPKLADLMGYSAEKQEEAGNVWNPVQREWEPART